MMLKSDQAVCIRAVDYSETSQVVTFFARLSGKLGVIAKGSKRAKSAFGGPIEPLSFGEIRFSDPGREKLATLTEFDQAPPRGGLRRHLFALDSAFFAAELVNRLTEELDPHTTLFDELVQFLQDLDDEAVASQRRDILVRLVLFQLGLLQEVGLRPVLHSCANCQRPFGPDWSQSYFSSAANGLICRDCEMNYPDRVQLSAPAVAALTDLKQLARLESERLEEIEDLLIRHFTETLGYRPKMADHIQGRQT
jgi:DNA repair protein RecO (recombination protein O)